MPDWDKKLEQDLEWREAELIQLKNSSYKPQRQRRARYGTKHYSVRCGRCCTHIMRGFANLLLTPI